jgi:hypothetical protein
MTAKQFIAIFSVLIITSVVYIYDTAGKNVSHTRCADYAMGLTYDAFPDAITEGARPWPSFRPGNDSVVQAKTTYDFFYNFCLNKRGW